MSNKTVVITGASSGIGFALAQAYLRRGDNVVGNARSQEGLAAAADRLGNPASFLPVAGDIALAGTAREIVGQAIARFGRIDVLINNAGIFIPKPLGEYTDDDLDRIIDTNLKGFFHITQQAAGHMAANRDGHIVNITASIALQPSMRVPALLPVLIKGGLNHATRALAIELSDRNIRVNAVAPGIIETPMHDPATFSFLNSLQPAGRMGKVDDIVGAVLYLTDSAYTTGAILPVDGGAAAGHW
ncbi:SDR family NAD(P)-dependent oxidoreductase [Achromobacter sp. NFACC18-2]|uniref:SDR family NAD(P)-dependent oxidoreductase n=1 Tax=Achromobacter sp. NFACC18-2 TaxID=1564112 RepID=UPI0008D0BC25|nr:SDR family oxidoreductase [Achromobacter sp. NFACC18-2]SEI42880.1 NAD(P)-dependent dehydrogenase, short-chain alcohol dehydrogenase family [Achromobacter sp. NFACC18-2]